MLDFGDVVIHVMSEDQRNYYDLESFYGAAEEVGMLHSCCHQHPLCPYAALCAKVSAWLEDMFGGL